MSSSVRSLCAALTGAAILVGCSPGGSTSLSAPSGVSQTHAFMLPEATTDNLLYVSDPGSGNVMVYGYRPDGMKFVGLLTGVPDPEGECVDKEQNVWITEGLLFQSYVLYRYAHGASAPDAVLSYPSGAPIGCAVNRSNGDLAVVAEDDDGTNLPVAIYKHARGKPLLYSYAALYPVYLTYDGKGNLFVIGRETGNPLKLLELPKGGSELEPISVSQQFSTTGGMAWDGKDLAIADGSKPIIYRFKIDGSNAKLVGSLTLNGAGSIHQLTVDHNRVLVPSNASKQSGVVSFYPYPAGGDRLRTLRNFSVPYAAVISRGP